MSHSNANNTLDRYLGRVSQLSPMAIGIVLFLISLVVRLHFAQNDLFHYESALIADAIQTSLDTGRFHTTNAGLTGIVFINYYLALFFGLFTTVNVVKLTILSTIVLSSLLIPVVFVFLRTITGNKLSSFAASLLFSLSPQFLLISTGSDAHALALLFIVASLSMIVVAEKKDSNSLRAFAALILGFAALMKSSSLVFVIPMIYIVWTGRPRHTWLKCISVFYVLFTSVFMGWILYVLDSRIFESNINVSFRTLFFAIQSLGTTLTIPGTLLFLYGAFYFSKKTPQHLKTFIVLLFIVPFAYHVVSASFTTRALSFTTIPLFFICAFGLHELWNKKKAYAVGACTVVLIFMIVYSVPILNYRSNNSHPNAVADLIMDNTESDAIVLLQYETIFLPEETEEREVAQIPTDGNLDSIYPIVQHLKNVIFLGKDVYTTTESFQDDVNGTLRRAILLNFNLEKKASIVTEDVATSALFSVPQEETLYKLQLNEFEDYTYWNSMPYEVYLKEAQILDSTILEGTIQDHLKE